MQSNYFEHCYSEISRLGAIKQVYREGYGMLPPKVIKLLNSLDGCESIKRCLIPYAGNGEMVLKYLIL